MFITRPVDDPVRELRTRLYTLEGREPVACHDYAVWAAAHQAGLDPAQGQKWRVGYDSIGEYEVSTVFLGMDMKTGAFKESGPPILFETMLFGPEGSVEGMGRSTTYDLAEARHKEVARRVRILVDSQVPKIEGQGDDE